MNKLIDISDDELNMIKDEYKEDFIQLYKIYLKGVKFMMCYQKRTK